MFIPQAWTFLLQVLAREDQVKDIFQYWPPPGDSNDYIHPTTATSGITSTATIRKPQGTLQTVFNCVILVKLAVWPVYVPVALPSSPMSPRSPSGSAPRPPPPAQTQALALPPEFAELGDLKIARDTHFAELRNALAECGIRFTNPPEYFKSFIEGSTTRKFEFLEPENVYQELLVRF